MPVPATVEEYLASLPPDRRAGVEILRRAARAGARNATETIAYGMPTLRSHGRQFLVSYAAFKTHYRLFPASDPVIDACGDELTPFLSGKGTIRFPADRPIPAALVRKIVKVRFAENAARERG